jgi:hypothetical protein
MTSGGFHICTFFSKITLYKEFGSWSFTILVDKDKRLKDICAPLQIRVHVCVAQVTHEFDRPHSAYMLFYERSEELEPITLMERATAVPASTSIAEPVSSGIDVRLNTSLLHALQ